MPAGAARDLGLDRSMVLGYGQDDRVCAYTSLVAQLDAEAPARTAVTLLVDKEEIGSVGATGMTSHFFEDTMAEVLELAGQSGPLALRRCLANSDMLSSDVSAGFDPTFASVFEPKNSAYLGHGLAFNKYTGARGKADSNDADAEYVATIRRIMDEGGVHFQTAELGKVDAGGGGTIAYILATYGMNVIDCAFPCSPCTRRGRPRARPTSTRPIAATGVPEAHVASRPTTREARDSPKRCASRSLCLGISGPLRCRQTLGLGGTPDGRRCEPPPSGGSLVTLCSGLPGCWGGRSRWRWCGRGPSRNTCPC